MKQDSSWKSKQIFSSLVGNFQFTQQKTLEMTIHEFKGFEMDKQICTHIKGFLGKSTIAPELFQEIYHLNQCIETQLLHQFYQLMDSLNIQNFEIKLKLMKLILQMKDIKKGKRFVQQVKKGRLYKNRELQILCNYLQPFVSHGLNQLELHRIVEVLELYLSQYYQLFKEIFKGASKLSYYFHKYQIYIKDHQLMKQIRIIVQKQEIRDLALLRVQIIFDHFPSLQTVSKQQQFWELRLLKKDDSESYPFPKPWEEETINHLPSFPIFFLEGQNYEKISVSSSKNGYLSSIFGTLVNQHSSHYICSNSPLEDYYQESLRIAISQIRKMDEIDFNVLSKKWNDFKIFIAGQRKIWHTAKKSQVILDIINHMLDQSKLFHVQVLFWTAFSLKKNFWLYKQAQSDRNFKIYNREAYKDSSNMIFYQSSSSDLQKPDLYRLVKMSQDRKIKNIQQYGKKVTKNKDQLALFKNSFIKILKNQKNFQLSQIETMKCWEGRSRQTCVSSNYKKTSLNQLIEFLQKRNHSICIVCQTGLLNTDFKRKHTYRIWLSPEGFNELLWGMKLPNSKGETKATLSAFQRVWKEMIQLSEISYLVFQNLEVLSDGQLDTFSDFLEDYTNDLLQINGQRISFQKNCKIILRTRRVQIKHEWAFSNLVNVFELQPIMPKQRQENKQKHCLKLARQGENIFLLLGSTKIKITQGFLQSITQQKLQKYISNSRNIQELFIQHNFLLTQQNIEILMKCQSVVQENSIFLVIEGPTGVGKTYVPTFYAKLRYGEFDPYRNMLKTKQNSFATISFHKGQSEMELQGRFIVQDDKIQWKRDTTFVKVVQCGGVILLSQLNTVVKHNQAHLAWWLKKISQTPPDQKGDRTINLQSVPTHNKQFYQIKIKKGCLIVIDINTSDYYGRVSLPSCFEPVNRLVIKSLFTFTSEVNQQAIQQELSTIARYIKYYWMRDNQCRQINGEPIETIIFKEYAKIFRDIVKGYELGKYGKNQQNEGFTKKWHFSLREIQRVVEDLKESFSFIPKPLQNLNEPQKEKVFKVFYQNFALRWKQSSDRDYISNILLKSLNSEKLNIQIFKEEFLNRNLIKYRRVVLWMMNQDQKSAKEELLNMKIGGLKQENIEHYCISNQVGDFELLGGNIPQFRQGILLNWLQQNRSSQSISLLVLQNIDKLDAGFISMLNNFTQNLKEGVIWVNSKQYRMPQKGAILFVAREQINWSPAESSRPMFFRTVSEGRDKKQAILEEMQRKTKQCLRQKSLEGEEQKMQIQNLEKRIKEFFKDLIKKMKSWNQKIFKDFAEKLKQTRAFDDLRHSLGKTEVQSSYQIKVKQLEQQKEKLQENIQEIEARLRGYQKSGKSDVNTQLINEAKREREETKTKIAQIDDLIEQINDRMYEQSSEVNIKQEMESDYQSKFYETINQIIQNIDKRPQVISEFTYKQEDQKIYLTYIKPPLKIRTSFQSIPLQNTSRSLAMTKQLRQILHISLNCLKDRRAIYYQGNAGVGKTKLTQYIAEILRLPIHIFQMSANIELADLIGGLTLSYEDNKRAIKINRRKKLIQFIKNGGIFVLDEGAMSQQAKEVISWFSPIVQNKEKERFIQLWDVPGKREEERIKIHQDFHLIITGNDPNKTIGRKHLPEQIIQFVEKIIIPETGSNELEQIVNHMIVRITGQHNRDFGKKLADIHSNIQKKLHMILKINKRNIMKAIRLFKAQSLNDQKNKAFDIAIYLAYFAGLSSSEHNQILRESPEYRNFIGLKKEISSRLLQFIQIATQNKQPLLMSYEEGSKQELLQKICTNFKEVKIIKAMGIFNEENLLGGFSPCQGKMKFQRSGIGALLKQNQGQHAQSKTEVLIMDSIDLIKEGSRTQLNQILQDGWTYINEIKCYWPSNLRLIFLIPVQKIGSLSEQYISRHQHFRYQASKKKEINQKKIYCSQIKDEIMKGNSVQILNLFGTEPEKKTSLTNFRKQNRFQYEKLNISDDMDESDWMSQIIQNKDSFELNFKGLFKSIKDRKKVIQIYGLERNPKLINVIQSIIYSMKSKKSQIYTMIPGLTTFPVGQVKIILTTNERVDKICPEVKEWNVHYYEVFKDRKSIIDNIMQKSSHKSSFFTISTRQFNLKSPQAKTWEKEYKQFEKQTTHTAQSKKIQQTKQARKQSIQKRKANEQIIPQIKEQQKIKVISPVKPSIKRMPSALKPAFSPEIKQPKQQPFQSDKQINQIYFEGLMPNDQDIKLQQAQLKNKYRLALPVYKQPSREGFFVTDKNGQKRLFQIYYDLSLKKSLIKSDSAVEILKIVTAELGELQILQQLFEGKSFLQNIKTLQFYHNKINKEIEIKKFINKLKNKISSFKNLERFVFSLRSPNLKSFNQAKQMLELLQAPRLSKILELSLDFKNNKWINNTLLVKYIGSLLSNFKQLSFFSLSCQNCENFEQSFIPVLSKELKKCKKIKSLTLNFGGVKVTDTSVKTLANMLQQLHLLDQFYLNLSNNDEIKQIHYLVGELLTKSLKKLYLNFRNCPKLSQKSQAQLDVYKEKYKLIGNGEPYVFEIHNTYLTLREFSQIKRKFIQDNFISNTNQQYWDSFYFRNQEKGEKILQRTFLNTYRLSETYEKYYIYYQTKYFSIQDFIKNSSQISFSSLQGLLQPIILLFKKKYLNLSGIQMLLQNMIFQQNIRNNCISPSQWSFAQSINFLRTFKTGFGMPQDYKWNLYSIIGQINYSLFDKTDIQLSNKLSQCLAAVYRNINLFVKNESLKSKYYWIRYVGGRAKGIVYSKSGGNFVLKRYLQGKTTFYSRVWELEGDENLEKKMGQQYDKFFTSFTDEEITALLKENPKLIYCLNNEILRDLAHEKTNNRFNEALTKTKEFLPKLPQDIQKAIKNIK